MKTSIQQLAKTYIKAENALLKALRKLPDYGNSCGCKKIHATVIIDDPDQCQGDTHNCLVEICLTCGGDTSRT